MVALRVRCNSFPDLLLCEAKMMRLLFAVCTLAAAFSPDAASAWGYQGHRVVGSVADKLLKPNAKQQVRQILGDIDLRKAGPWADCVKSVVRHDEKFEKSFHY